MLCGMAPALSYQHADPLFKVFRRVTGPTTCKGSAWARAPSESSDEPTQSVPLAAGSRRRPSIESVLSTGTQAEYSDPEQTVILFDWDDTLCPSTWIKKNRPILSFSKEAPKDERFQRPLRELEIEVEAVLKLAMKLGKVIIVTNAMNPWVETSCRNFLPNLLPIVSKLPVLYARSIYEAHCCDALEEQDLRWASRVSTRGAPGMYKAMGFNNQEDRTEPLPQLWKEVAFEQEISSFYSRYSRQSWKNVISIGDSIFERDAVRRVVLDRPCSQKKCRTKTAKLLDEPTIRELIIQVRMIYESLSMMVQYDDSLDIEIDEDDLRFDLPLAGKFMEF